MRMQQEVQIKESRWSERAHKRLKQPEGEDRTEMKEEARVLRCALLKGSAWSTEKKNTRRYEGKCDFFFWESAQAEEGGNGGAVQQRG